MSDKQIKKTLYMGIHKDLNTGKLLGVLSSDAVDREDEIISSKLLHKWKSSQSIPALTDHTNSINTYAGGWKNFRLEKSGDTTALIAEPIFFKSNPNTAYLESMVKEAKELGLPFGISIGAIVKEVSSVQRGNKSFTQWDDAELLEASWVAIPANRTAGIKSLMKSLNAKPVDESDLNIKMVEKQEKKTDSENPKEDNSKGDSKEDTTDSKDNSKESASEDKTDTSKEDSKDDEKKDNKKSFTLEEVKSLIASEVSAVQKSFKESSEKSEKLLNEKVTDAIAEALKNIEAEKKSVKTEEKKELDLTNLTNG